MKTKAVPFGSVSPVASRTIKRGISTNRSCTQGQPVALELGSELGEDLFKLIERPEAEPVELIREELGEIVPEIAPLIGDLQPSEVSKEVSKDELIEPELLEELYEPVEQLEMKIKEFEEKPIKILPSVSESSQAEVVGIFENRGWVWFINRAEQTSTETLYTFFAKVAVGGDSSSCLSKSKQKAIRVSIRRF